MHHATTTTGADMIVLTAAEYEALSNTSEDRIDAALIDQARAEDEGLPTIPADKAMAILDGTLHPLTMWRDLFGLSMAEIGKRAGIRPATVSDIENGKIDPRYSTVQTLAQAMHPDLNAADIMP